MLVSIIVPVYNEQSTIQEVLKRVERVSLPRIEKEIIVVDDGSTDGTRAILEKLKKYRIFFHNTNQGKGAAIRTGLERARGEVVIIQDADLEYSPKEYPKLLKPILENKAAIIYGSRFLNKKYKLVGKEHVFLPSHYLGNIVLNWALNLLYHAHLTDMETGYKVFKRNVTKGIKLQANRFEFEPEFTVKALKRGYQILEIPISHKPRDFAEGKKITWKDGFIALWYILKYRFVD